MSNNKSVTKNNTIRVTDSEKELIVLLRNFEPSILIRSALKKSVEDKVKLIDGLKEIDRVDDNSFLLDQKFINTLELEIESMLKVLDLLIDISDLKGVFL